MVCCNYTIIYIVGSFIIFKLEICYCIQKRHKDKAFFPFYPNFFYFFLFFINLMTVGFLNGLSMLQIRGIFLTKLRCRLLRNTKILSWLGFKHKSKIRRSQRHKGHKDFTKIFLLNLTNLNSTHY